MTDSPFARVVSALEQRGQCPSHRSDQNVMARCPAHDDQHPSLSVSEDSDGRVLLKCHAGCSWKAVVQSLGLNIKDLFPTSTTWRPATRSCAWKPEQKSFKSSDAARSALERTRGPVSAQWEYHDAAGDVVGVVVRWDRPDGEKEIRPLAVVAGQWVIRAMPEPRPLYRLPHLAGAHQVFVVEGEKAADAAVSIGLTATTSSGGAESPAKTDWGPLAGRNVVIIPDHDAAGHRYAMAVAEQLQQLDHPAQVRIVSLKDCWPEIREKDDIADWVAAHAGVDQSTLCGALLSLVEAAPPFHPETKLKITVEPAAGSRPVNANARFSLEPAALTGLPGRFVAAVIPHTEADEAALLFHYLTFAAARIGRGVYFRVGGTDHFPCLFTCVVGQSAKARKGTAYDLVDLHFKQFDRHCSDPLMFTPENLLGGLVSGEGLIWAVRDPLPSGGDVTSGVTDKRLLVTETEFGAVLRACSRRENSLSNVIRQAWDGKDLRTAGKKQPARATAPCINIIGHITREELRCRMAGDDAANGFANRFLWVASHRSKLLPHGGLIDKGLLDTLSQEAADALSSVHCGGPLSFSPEAYHLWEDAYPELTADCPSLPGKVTSRAEAQTLRLSMLYALLSGHVVIQADHLQAALACWRYCFASACWAFGEHSERGCADSILEALRSATPHGLTRSDVSRHFSNNRPAAEISQGLNSLVEAGLIRCETQSSTGGRPSTRFFAVAPEGDGGRG